MAEKKVQNNVESSSTQAKKGRLILQASVKFLFGAASIAALLLVPAGTLAYPNAWLFMGLLFIPMLIAGIVLLLKNPQLLQKRIDSKENETEQKAVLLLGGLMFLGGFVVAGLDFRFQWLALPRWLVYAASAVFLLSYLLYAEVMRENTYLSRTVKIQEHQKVIDTGLYGIVRHPMYSATIFLFMSMPLVLGSLLSFLVFLMYPIIIAKRIRNEEKVLEQGLEGYAEYKKRVKYKVLPFIW